MLIPYTRNHQQDQGRGGHDPSNVASLEIHCQTFSVVTSCQSVEALYIVVDVEIFVQRVAAGSRGGTVVGHRVCRHGKYPDGVDWYHRQPGVIENGIGV